jgi:hypothetical protein
LWQKKKPKKKNKTKKAGTLPAKRAFRLAQSFQSQAAQKRITLEAGAPFGQKSKEQNAQSAETAGAFAQTMQSSSLKTEAFSLITTIAKAA